MSGTRRKVFLVVRLAVAKTKTFTPLDRVIKDLQRDGHTAEAARSFVWAYRQLEVLDSRLIMALILLEEDRRDKLLTRWFGSLAFVARAHIKDSLRHDAAIVVV